jgi:hypothetical protein
MAGRKRGVDLTARDVLPYEPGNTYDVYVGIVVRQDIPNPEHYAERLIFGFFGALCELAQEGIAIRRMYAISDQERSVRISRKLGFVEQPSNSGRFVLDMETAESTLVRKYREVVQHVGELPHQDKSISRKITYDPQLEETLQNLLDTLNNDDTVNHTQVVTLLLPLIDQLAKSPQMTIEQQAVLRNIHEILANPQ